MRTKPPRRRLVGPNRVGTTPIPPAPLWNTSVDFFDATAAVVLPFSALAVTGTYIACFINTAPGSVTTNTGGLTNRGTTTLTPTSSGGRLTYLDGTVGAGNTPGTPITINLDGSSRWYAILATTGIPRTGAITLDPTNTTGTTVAAPSGSGVAGQLAVYWYGVITNVSAIQPLWTPDPLTTLLKTGTSQSGSARNATGLVSYEVLTSTGATPVRVATADNTIQKQAGLLLLT